MPTGNAVQASASYRDALKAYDSSLSPGFVSFEGYLAGRLAAYAVERCGERLSRDCIYSVFRIDGDIDLDGFILRYGKDDNQGSDRVFLTVIGSDGEYAALTSLTSAAAQAGASRTQQEP